MKHVSFFIKALSILLLINVFASAFAQSAGRHPLKEKGMLDQDILNVLEEHKEKCMQNDGISCSIAAEWHIDGLSPIPQNHNTALKYFDHGCTEANNTNACWGVYMLLIDRKVDFNKNTFVNSLDQVCKLKDIEGCIELAKFYFSGRAPENSFFPPNEEKADYYVAKICHLDTPPYKFADACTHTGGKYEYGIGVDENLETARMFYSMGCDRGHMKACKDMNYLDQN